jgi:hypothetical protein
MMCLCMKGHRAVLGIGLWGTMAGDQELTGVMHMVGPHSAPGDGQDSYIAFSIRGPAPFIDGGSTEKNDQVMNRII